MSNELEQAKLRKKIQKEYPDFVEAVSGMSVQQLESRLTTMAKHRIKTKQAKKEDDAWQDVREMVTEEGGFASSLDADSEGEEDARQESVEVLHGGTGLVVTALGGRRRGAENHAEGVQGEGGVIPTTKEFMRELRQFTKENNILFFMYPAYLVKF